MAVSATDPFERLYRRYAHDVYRFALAVVRNPTEAEDVTQTAFLNAFRAYARGERPERPHSWLIAIAHNAIRSRGRLRLRRPAEVALDAAGELAAPPVERPELGPVLHALGRLPANQRDALAMRELEGRSYGEIASALGVSVPAVESLLARARRTLRRQRDGLRGLLVLLSLRHGDEAGSGVAAKAAVAVAAAGLAAGGLGVASKVAVTPRRAQAPATSVHAVRPPAVEAVAVAVRTPRSHARIAAAPAPAPPAPRPVVSRPFAPPPAPSAPAPAAPAPAAAPAAPAPPSAPPVAAAPVPTAPAAPSPAPSTTTATTTTDPTPAPAVVVAVTATTVTTPPATVETPVATVSVPAVTVTVPVPSVPQVSGLSGID